MSRPTLNEMLAFCTVAERRSFRQAADVLGMSPSTLSHAIGALERRMGVRLLHRTTRSVAATEAGEELWRRMEPLLAEYDHALEETRQIGGMLAGTVRINAAAAAIRPMFDAVLPLLKQKHPDIHVECIADGRLIDIVAEGFDAGIRLGDVVPKDMIGVPFGPSSRFVALAAPSYLVRHGHPTIPADLGAHDCIRMRLASGRLFDWSFSRDGVTATHTPEGTYTLSDIGLQIEAAASGLGIAYVWEEAARSALANGSVQPVLEAWWPQAERLMLYYPGNRRVPPPLRGLIDVIQEVRG